MRDGTAARENAFPLVSLAGAGAAVVLAFLLVWPSWLLGATWFLPDTTSYLNGGAAIWAYAMDVLSFDSAEEAVKAPLGGEDGPASVTGAPNR